MIKTYKFLIIVIIVLCITSCTVSIQRTALNNHDKMTIQSTHILLNSTQREIAMRHNNWFNSDASDPYSPVDSGPIVHHNKGVRNNNLVSDLIIASVQNYQASSAITSLKSIRDALEDFDFLNYFNIKLKNTVANQAWLKVRKQEIKYNLNLEGNESKIVRSSKVNATLFIGTTYYFSSTFRQLEVAAYVKLVQKSVNNQEPHTLYTNNFFFINRLPEPNNNEIVNKAKWINNNGEMIKIKLRDAASLLSNMISMDIGNTNVEGYASNQDMTIRTEGLESKVSLIKKQNNYYIVMSSSKEIYAVNQYDVVNKNG